MELGLLPQGFHALVPSLRCSRTLPAAVCQQGSPPAQFLCLLVPDCAQCRAAPYSDLLYWHVTGTRAREKEKLPWRCLESPVLRRALLRPWTNTLLSHIRSFNQYFSFLSLITFVFFQPLNSTCLGHSLSLPCLFFLSMSWSLKTSKISSVS